MTAIILAVLMCVGIVEGLWSLSQVLSLVPYFLLAAMIGVLIWGFRDRIERSLKRRIRLELTLLTEDSKNQQEIQVRCSDGVLHFPTDFQFITLKNLSGPTINDVELYFDGFDSGQFRFIERTGPDHITVDETDETMREFRARLRQDALRIAFLDHSKTGKDVLAQLHQDKKFGKTFVLFFTPKDYASITIPCAGTRTYKDFPCERNVSLYAAWRDHVAQYLATFHVKADNWKSVHITPTKVKHEPDATWATNLRQWMRDNEKAWGRYFASRSDSSK